MERTVIIAILAAACCVFFCSSISSFVFMNNNEKDSQKKVGTTSPDALKAMESEAVVDTSFTGAEKLVPPPAGYEVPLPSGLTSAIDLGGFGVDPWGRQATFPDNDARWIWNSSGARESAPMERVLFFKEFTNRKMTVVKATVNCIADNVAVIKVNGKEVGSKAGGWDAGSALQPISIELVPGRNVIEVSVTNNGGPAGLVASVLDTTGKVLFLTDATWRCMPARVQGRKIKLYFDDGKQHILNIREIRALGPGNANLSSEKPASMSSTLDDDTTRFPAEILTKSVDSTANNTNNVASLIFGGSLFQNFLLNLGPAHTKNEVNPYMVVDLGADQEIKYVTVRNRNDCCKERVVGAKLQVINNNGETVSGPFTITDVQDVYTFVV